MTIIRTCHIFFSLQEEDVDFQQLSLQRPTMRGDDLRGSILARAMPARVSRVGSPDEAMPMHAPEPVLPEHAVRMPFNLQQPQALSDLAADGKIADSTPADTMPDSSISADDLANSDEPSLSSLDGPHVPVQVQTYVHHRVNDVFQNALEHELDQAKVDAAHKKAELENVKCTFLFPQFIQPSPPPPGA